MRIKAPDSRALFGSPKTDSLQRRMRQRLIRLLTMLMLVLALIRHASNPENWNWFWQVTAPPGPSSSQDSPSAGQSPGTLPAPEATLASPAEPVLSPELLHSIQDNTYFRPEETEAWFRSFAYLRARSCDELRQASLGRVTYLQLYRQTDFYRGRIVELAGTLRRAHLVEAPPNPQGFSNYWQCWLFLDSSVANPIVVYCLKLPDGFKEGMELAVPVRLQGCVYKRWAYAAGSSMFVAPVVLASTMEASTLPSAVPRQDRTANHSRPPGLPAVLLGCLALAILAIALAGLIYRSGNMASRVRPRMEIRIGSSEARSGTLEQEESP